MASPLDANDRAFRDDLTIGARDGTGSTYGAHALRVCAIRELEPVVGVRLQVLSLDLQGKVNVVAGEGGAGVDWTSGQVLVVKDLERDANWDALVRKSSSDRDSPRPQKDRGVEGVALEGYIR